MRRRLRTIAIFLLAGAVMNVAVAIGCALCLNPFATFNYDGAYAGRIDGEMWFAERWSRRGVVLVISLRSLGPAATPDHTDPSPSDLIPRWFQRQPIAEDETDNRLLGAYGWPLVALRYECHVPNGEPSSARCECVETGLAPWRDPISPKTLERVIPCRPVWRGQVVNALLYAGLLWLLILGPFALRRLIRQRRGLCLACGYDLRHGEHEACPECGVTA